MPPRLVELHPLAVRELQTAFRTYNRRSPATARRFQEAVARVVQRVRDAAELGAPFRQRYRWMRLHRFPYLLYYEIRDPHPVLIYAAAHSSRRSGYWLRRRP